MKYDPTPYLSLLKKQRYLPLYIKFADFKPDKNLEYDLFSIASNRYQTEKHQKSIPYKPLFL